MLTVVKERSRSNGLTKLVSFRALSDYTSHRKREELEQLKFLRKAETLQHGLVQRLVDILKLNLLKVQSHGFYAILTLKRQMGSTYIHQISQANYTAKINKNMIFNMSVVNSKLEQRMHKRYNEVQTHNATHQLAKILLTQRTHELNATSWAFGLWQDNISFQRAKVNQYRHYNEMLETENTVLKDEINQIQEAAKELQQEQEEPNIGEHYPKEIASAGLTSPTTQTLAKLKLDPDQELRESFASKTMPAATDESEDNNEFKDWISHYEFLEKQNIELLELIDRTEEELEAETTGYSEDIAVTLDKINQLELKKSAKTEITVSKDKSSLNTLT